MSISLASLIPLLQSYGYYLLVPIVIVEGPIATVVAGFLVSLGYMNGFIAYPLIVLSDLIGDAIHYVIGRRFLRHPKINEKLEKHFQEHPKKTLFIGKFAHGVSGVPLFAAGVAKMPFVEFMLINFLATLPKSLILMLLGYFFGSYVYKINGYFSIAGWIMALLAAGLVVLYYFLGKKFLK